jgi:hypothetical protein
MAPALVGRSLRLPAEDEQKAREALSVMAFRLRRTPTSLEERFVEIASPGR